MIKVMKKMSNKLIYLDTTPLTTIVRPVPSILTYDKQILIRKFQQTEKKIIIKDLNFDLP